MMFTVLLLFASSLLIAALFIWWYQNYSRFFILLKKIPGPRGYPVVGNIFDFFGSPEELFKIDRQLCKQYYPIYKECVLSLGAVNLFHPDDIELVLSNNKHIEKSVIYNYMHAWLGTGLLTSGGAKWQARRKILTPAFHFSILQEFVPIFNGETQKLVQELKKHCHESINVIDPVTKFTLLSIAETSMGVKLDASPKSCEEYKNAIYSFGYGLTYRLPRPWLSLDFIFYYCTQIGQTVRKSIQILHDFSRNVIADKKRYFSQVPKTKRKMAMLDLLLSAKNQGADIDDEGIAEEVDTFMFEGHDTTSVAICYTLLLLANHPKIQQELFEEMKEVLGHPMKVPTYNDLKELTFMERCLKESLRLFPSVPFISRVLSEDITTSTGYVIPKGAMTHIHIYDLHHNSNLYPDPEKFDPDRFLPENTKDRHPFAYLPFSAGPRNCIGQKFAMLELKAVLCGILNTFALEAEDKPEDVTMITDLVLRSKNGIRIKFKLRDMYC